MRIALAKSTLAVPPTYFAVQHVAGLRDHPRMVAVRTAFGLP